MRQFIANRMREPSTWRGLVWLVVGLAGIQVDAGEVEQVLSAGALLAGLIGFVARDS